MIFNIPSEDTGKDIVSLKSSVTATQRMFAPILSSMVATSNLYVGDYVIVSDKLYRITTNISNGGTITEGTNATRILNGERPVITKFESNKEFEERVVTTLSTITVTPGVWMFIGTHTMGDSSNFEYQDQIMLSTAGSSVIGVSRNISGVGGGGATTFGIANPLSVSTYNYCVYGYGTAGTTRTASGIKFLAVKLY